MKQIGQLTEEKKLETLTPSQTENIVTPQASSASSAIIVRNVGLHLTTAQARKLYGVISFVFNDFQKHPGRICGEEAIMALIPISEALAVQLDRSQGMNPDVSDISLEAFKIGAFE